jgi:hypothetical protein
MAEQKQRKLSSLEESVNRSLDIYNISTSLEENPDNAKNRIKLAKYRSDGNKPYLYNGVPRDALNEGIQEVMGAEYQRIKNDPTVTYAALVKKYKAGDLVEILSAIPPVLDKKGDVATYKDVIEAHKMLYGLMNIGKIKKQIRKSGDTEGYIGLVINSTYQQGDEDIQYLAGCGSEYAGRVDELVLERAKYKLQQAIEKHQPKKADKK